MTDVRRILLFSTLTALALAMGMGLMGGTAIAEETSNESAGPEYEVEFGDDLRILEYQLEDGTATITFDADRPFTVVVSDALAGVDQEGAVEVPQEEFEIDTGETTISTSVREVNGASTVGVSVQGTTVRLGTEMEAQEENPFETFGGESGLFTGVIMTTGLAGLGTAYVIRSEDSGVIEA
ncbi:hypothetical protein C482_13019 [Natrialba chahannaoensis JCM 10990]|uniref:Uncharacterized protein n=1 Tax=Natrialba chahannaoensis JCM 10990 TaxID=1227492 RepID=M0AFP7_9EURY|nr:hypothetical protein [Natrialba chahannaoensis]ELY97545.1 hypothetical protein C482_13019 [Natrialba chahannaoensis JCM 10990]